MHSQKTSPPGSRESQLDRPPNPGDVTDDFIEALRSGDDSELFTEEDAAAAEEEEAALASVRPPDHKLPQEPWAVPPTLVVEPHLPPVLQRIFGTEAESELMAVAKLLDPQNKKKLTLVFHLDVGDIKCPVNWCSQDPARMHQAENLLLILVRSSNDMFAPRPGAELEISFAEHHKGGAKLKVTCLAPPMSLYPGVGIDLLCFLPHTKDVEKNGVLANDAPSVVSGDPSTDVDAAGEPIVEGEKSASVVSLPKQTDYPRGANVDAGTLDERAGFDKPREA